MIDASAIATYAAQSGTRRIFKWSRCGETFSETRDPVFFDWRTEEEKVMRALKRLRVPVELTAITFVRGVTELTLLEGLHRAALKAQELNEHLVREVSVTHGHWFRLIPMSPVN